MGKLIPDISGKTDTLYTTYSAHYLISQSTHGLTKIGSDNTTWLIIPIKTIMLIYLPERKAFNTRKEAKDYLGGTNKYNKAFKNGDLFFMND